MKSPQEFRLAVYDKRDKKILAQKRVRLLTALPLAAFVVVCGVLFVPKLAKEAPTSSGHIPLTLQVGKPAEPQRVTYDYYDQLREELLGASSEADSEEAAPELSEEQYRELEEKFEQAVTENERIEKEFQSALNDFARDTAGVVSEQFEGNGCYSPLSLYYALSLCGAGARGETEREFVELLHVPTTDWAAEQCAKYYRQHYTPEIPGERPSYVFRLADSLWMDGRCTFGKDYIATAQEDFYASLFQADFTDPAIGEEIGKWVQENTNGLLAPNLQFSPDTMLAILNTLYFDAPWVNEFWEMYNETDDFTRADGTTGAAEYMTQTTYSSEGLVGDGFLRADRPLQLGFRMIFILPDEGVDPLSLLQDPEAFEQMFYPGETGTYEVHWRLPKFTFECEYDLMSSLKALGLETAADGNRADFSGMYDALPPGYGGLALSQAKQGVYVNVDEKGVEAAAYTMVAMEAGGAYHPTDQTVLEMNLNRPFLFAIAAPDQVTEPQEDTSQYYDGYSLLFVGVCADPSQK